VLVNRHFITIVVEQEILVVCVDFDDVQFFVVVNRFDIDNVLLAVLVSNVEVFDVFMSNEGIVSELK
jgi:hypothetical protein